MTRPPRCSELERRVREEMDGVPEVYRKGIVSVEVILEAPEHPVLEAYYTLGECVPHQVPWDIGENGEVLSDLVIYYGSFRKLAESDPDFDWREELRETILHEIRHHLEARAGTYELEREDYAHEHDTRRRQGLAHDPRYYHHGREIEAGCFEVEDLLFIEVALSRRTWDQWVGREVTLETPAGPLEVSVPERSGPSVFLDLEDEPITIAFTEKRRL